MSAPVNSRPTVTAANILQGAGKVTLDGIEVGSYQGGIKLTKTQSEKTVESELLMGEIDSEIEKVGYEVDLELEEATLENMAWAMVGTNSSSCVSGTSSKVLEGIPPASMREMQLVFEGQSATNKLLLRTFTCYRATVIGGTNVTFQRGTKVVVPVKLKLLMNTSGSFFNVKDKTI